MFHQNSIQKLRYLRKTYQIQERAEKEAAEKEAERARLAEIEAEKKKKQKAEINATKKQRKIFRNVAKVGVDFFDGFSISRQNSNRRCIRDFLKNNIQGCAANSDGENHRKTV